MIKLICIGRIKEQTIAELVNEYCKRIQRFAKLEIIEVEDEKITGIDETNSMAAEITREMEARKVIKILENSQKTQHIIILDENGTLFSSQQLAERIKAKELEGDVIFVVGGALGLSQEIKKKANLMISMSRMTFTHQLARMILLEQIYRAYTIINNMPYHK